MKLLESKILKDGIVLKGNVLKVGSFLNQQIDVELTNAMAEEVYSHFKNKGVTKILTVEASGIALAYAVANKYTALFDLIKERYHTDKLERSKYRDNSAYSNNKVLPMNFNELENFLREIYNTKEPVNINPRRGNSYIKINTIYLSAFNGNISFSDDGIIPPKDKVKFKDKILMNKFVYSLGLILFKKGSKLRAFLKKHIW